MTQAERECMDNTAEARRTSALAGHCTPGKSGLLGADGMAGVVLQDVQGLVLWQVAAWPDTLDSVAEDIARAAGAPSAPGPCHAITGKKGSLLRIDPLRWWLVGLQAPGLVADTGVSLDLSHSRTHIRITGNDAVVLLNRFLPLDLRAQAFPGGSVASSFIHHVGVTLWHSDNGYELFVPRGFALAIWRDWWKLPDSSDWKSCSFGMSAC